MAAQNDFYAKQQVEWEACLAWWNCDNSGGGSSMLIAPGGDLVTFSMCLSKLNEIRTQRQLQDVRLEQLIERRDSLKLVNPAQCRITP